MLTNNEKYLNYNALHDEADFLFDGLFAWAHDNNDFTNLNPDLILGAILAKYPDASREAAQAAASKQFYIGLYRIVQSAVSSYIMYPESVGMKRNRLGYVDTLAIVESKFLAGCEKLLGSAGFAAIVGEAVEQIVGDQLRAAWLLDEALGHYDNETGWGLTAERFRQVLGLEMAEDDDQQRRKPAVLDQVAEKAFWLGLTADLRDIIRHAAGNWYAPRADQYDEVVAWRRQNIVEHRINKSWVSRVDMRTLLYLVESTVAQVWPAPAQADQEKTFACHCGERHPYAQGDIHCDCGAWFNSCGQQLRDDWQDRSTYAQYGETW